MVNGSFFAAGLIDELSLLVAPALDGRRGADRAVEYEEAGLAGKCSLSLMSSDSVGHGLVHLRYKVNRLP